MTIDVCGDEFEGDDESFGAPVPKLACLLPPGHEGIVHSAVYLGIITGLGMFDDGPRAHSWIRQEDVPEGVVPT